MNSSNVACSSMQRVLIIGEDGNSALTSRLTAMGAIVHVAIDGPTAVEDMRHGRFDAAVIVSTGNAMDVVETTLNLRELRPAMPIVIISDSNMAEPAHDENVPAAKLGPLVKFVNSNEVTCFLQACLQATIALHSEKQRRQV